MGNEISFLWFGINLEQVLPSRNSSSTPFLILSEIAVHCGVLMHQIVMNCVDNDIPLPDNNLTSQLHQVCCQYIKLTNPSNDCFQKIMKIGTCVHGWWDILQKHTRRDIKYQSINQDEVESCHQGQCCLFHDPPQHIQAEQRLDQMQDLLAELHASLTLH